MGRKKGQHKSEQEILPVLSPKTELSEIPEYIAAEVFLENCGFFTPSSKRVKDIYVKEKINTNEAKKILKTRISANHELGLPITSDFDYYRAFLKICDEIVDHTGRFQLPIAISTKKLIRYAGKTENARVKKEVRGWFYRMNWTGIKGAIFLAKHKKYEEEFAGTVFSQVVVRGKPMRNGKVAETNYVWPSPWFLSNYYYRHLRPIDFNLHRRLRKPIAKSLYPLLETGWYASDGLSYSKSYRDLCSEFLLTKHRHLSLIKQQLDPSHEELQQEKFLAKWEYRKTIGEEWVIIYYPGEKFFADQKARMNRRTLAEQIASKPKNIPACQSELSDKEEHLLYEILMVCKDGQNRAAYRKVIRNYPENLIWMVLSETRQADREGRIKKNKGAYFMDTLKRLAKLRSEAEEGKKE